ncbi:hypothetical protein [Rhodoblastus sp.]|uniref:hypothetical protein n=1 Tax=Rhodoblastus sp. TaxID=1962975 RepID=UPI0035B4F96B
MRTSELFRTCANEHVAAAALACIGGKLQRRVAAAARRAGVTTGALVARLVSDYDRKASPMLRKILETGMFRSEMPILAGLRHVVETALEDAWDVSLEVVRHASGGEARRRHWEARTGPLMRRELELKALYS